jgi:hypothetical protein
LKLFTLADPPSFDEMAGRHAVVFLKRPREGENVDPSKTFWLSEKGDLLEVGRNLFSLLERLDSQGFDVLFVEVPGKKGIGIAISDRLERASHH